MPSSLVFVIWKKKKKKFLLLFTILWGRNQKMGETEITPGLPEETTLTIRKEFPCGPILFSYIFLPFFFYFEKYQTK